VFWPPFPPTTNAELQKQSKILITCTTLIATNPNKAVKGFNNSQKGKIKLNETNGMGRTPFPFPPLYLNNQSDSQNWSG
jgi:hypothetical protein